MANYLDELYCRRSGAPVVCDELTAEHPGCPKTYCATGTNEHARIRHPEETDVLSDEDVMPRSAGRASPAYSDREGCRSRHSFPS